MDAIEPTEDGTPADRIRDLAAEVLELKAALEQADARGQAAVAAAEEARDSALQVAADAAAAYEWAACTLEAKRAEFLTVCGDLVGVSAFGAGCG